MNLLTGHGTSRDKTTATQFAANGRLTFAQLEALYHDEDLAARIIDAEPEQMYREGFDIRLVKKSPTKDPEAKQDAFGAPPGNKPPPGPKLPTPGKPKPKRSEFGDLEDELAEQCAALGVQEAFLEGQVLGRHYGGAAVFVGADDGRRPDQPLDETKIRSVDFLHVLDRYSLWPNTFYVDPKSPKFGKPETYRVFRPISSGIAQVVAANPQDDVIHETRLILFPGARTTIRRRVANFGWDDSVLQRVHPVLMQFGLSWTAATHLLSDASQGVYKVKNLLDMIAGNNKDELMTRMAIVDETRSTARMLLADADTESFERTHTPFGGIPEMLDRVVQRLAAAARIPVTVLMGMSPAGMNATGESDMRQWYDKIRTQQANVAAPRLKRLVTLLLAARGKTDLSVEIKFRPLWQPTALEEADRRLAIAQTDDIYHTMGALLEEEIRESRWGGDGYNPETTIDPELAGDALAAIKQSREPEPPPVITPDGKPVKGPPKPPAAK